MTSIAQTSGITKPSLYGQFGSKAQLFMRALARYGETIGSAPMQAFMTEPDIGRSVKAFLVRAIECSTEPGKPAGCLFACVTGSAPEDVLEARSFYRDVVAAAASTVADRFQAESDAGGLPAGFEAMGRARQLIDLMQAGSLRARAGESRECLLGYVPVQVQAVVGSRQV